MLNFGLNPIMDLPALRRKKLLWLIDARHKGNKKAFCQVAGISVSRLSQLLSTTYRKGGEFGERVARALEQKLHLEPLFFDTHTFGAIDNGRPRQDDRVEVGKDEFLRLMNIYIEADQRGRGRIMETAFQVEQDNLGDADLGTSTGDNG